MVDVQTISIVIMAVSVVLGIITWLSQNREMKEIQKTRLFMQLYQQLLSKDAQRDILELLDMEWEDYEDFEMKYGSENNPDACATRYYKWRQFNAIGYLLKKGLIDADMVSQLGTTTVIWQWTKWESIIKEIRVRYNQPYLGVLFEYLANELKKLWVQRGFSPEVPETFGRYIKE